ncbi:MAG: hypothetical protein K2Y37_02950 [Pirellulales bacterium]|nr:hypothetical protein [Pirellulales bacterium]
MKGIHPAVYLIVAAFYALCPLDGDFILVGGWLDDLLVAFICIREFNKRTRGPGPGQPGGMAIDVEHCPAPPRIQSPVDLLVTAKGNPNLN